MRMNSKISENRNLYWLTNNTRTINFINNTRYSPAVLWGLNMKGGKKPCCGRMHFQGTVNTLNVSSLCSGWFCYFDSRIFLKIWNSLLSLQEKRQQTTEVRFFWYLLRLSLFLVCFLFFFCLVVYFFGCFLLFPCFCKEESSQEIAHRPAKKGGWAGFFPPLQTFRNLLVDRKSSNWYSLYLITAEKVF